MFWPTDVREEGGSPLVDCLESPSVERFLLSLKTTKATQIPVRFESFCVHMIVFFPLPFLSEERFQEQVESEQAVWASLSLCTIWTLGPTLSSSIAGDWPKPGKLKHCSCAALWIVLSPDFIAVNGGQGMQTSRSPFEFCDSMEPVQLRTAPFSATNGSSPHPGLPPEHGRGAVPGPNPFQPDTGTCFQDKQTQFFLATWGMEGGLLCVQDFGGHLMYLWCVYSPINLLREVSVRNDNLIKHTQWCSLLSMDLNLGLPSTGQSPAPHPIPITTYLTEQQSQPTLFLTCKENASKASKLSFSPWREKVQEPQQPLWKSVGKVSFLHNLEKLSPILVPIARCWDAQDGESPSHYDLHHSIVNMCLKFCQKLSQNYHVHVH